MKHARKHIACVLTIIIAVVAFPTTTHATTANGMGNSDKVTIGGLEYSLSQTDQAIRVTAREKGKIVDSCTAYPEQGYMVSEDTANSKAGTKVFTVSWLDDLVKDAAPSRVPTKAAIAPPTWTKDGKYIYNPSLISLNPITYKAHTAYYWYKNLGTKPDFRTLYIKKGMTITQVVTLITLVVSGVATCGLTFAEGLVVAGAMGIGSTALTDGIVSRTISPTVMVQATNYEAKFRDSLGAGIGPILEGSKVIVSDPESKYYKKVFYEKYCPQLSQNFDKLAYMYTFKGSYYRYPGLKSYVEL